MGKNCFILFILPLFLSAQEVWVPLLGKIQETNPGNFQLKQSMSAASLMLPFKDDFSNADRHTVPDASRWLPCAVAVNHGMAKAPPTLGMATMDGLNRWGLPYQPEGSNWNASDAADTLCSRCINLKMLNAQQLQLSDSIALSFYVLAGGWGDMPEIQDSLILDFYNPQTRSWNNRIWFMKGPALPSVNDTVFKRCFVPITQSDFLQDSFQFRFRNKATVMGAFDNWHLDYIYLDRYRSAHADTVYNDIAFTKMPSPWFNSARSLPFAHCNAALLQPRQSVYITNLNGQPINMQYQRSIQSHAMPSSSYSGGFTNLQPYLINGCSTFTPHSNPPNTFTVPFSGYADSVCYFISHRLNRGTTFSDFFPHNDTLSEFISLSNVFAMDDGSAECGYLNKSSNGKMAYQIELQKTDSLRGLQIYWDPVASLKLKALSYRFNIKVWSESGGKPGSLLYDNGASYPHYADSLYKPFTNYIFKNPIKLNKGQYFIGIEQFVAEGIPIGFDRNTDFSSRLWVDAGSGWKPSGLYGSLMMRPVVGSDFALGFNKPPSNKLVIFPNPAQTEFNIVPQSDLLFYQIWNMQGVCMYQGRPDRLKVDVAHWQEGIYTLVFYKTSGSESQILIVLHN